LATLRKNSKARNEKISSSIPFHQPSALPKEDHIKGISSMAINLIQDQSRNLQRDSSQLPLQDKSLSLLKLLHTIQPTKLSSRGENKSLEGSTEGSLEKNTEIFSNQLCASGKVKSAVSAQSTFAHAPVPAQGRTQLAVPPPAHPTEALTAPLTNIQSTAKVNEHESEIRSDAHNREESPTQVTLHYNKQKQLNISIANGVSEAVKPVEQHQEEIIFPPAQGQAQRTVLSSAPLQLATLSSTTEKMEHESKTGNDAPGGDMAPTKDPLLLEYQKEPNTGVANRGSKAMNPVKEQQQEEILVSFCICNKTSEGPLEKWFRAKKTSKISRLIKSWFKSQNVKPRDDVELYFKQRLISRKKTLDSLAIKDGDEMELRTNTMLLKQAL
jgi:hypothetical protein